MTETIGPARRVPVGLALILLVQLGLTDAASAQPAPAHQGVAAPAAEKPQRTTASYDDWILQCDKRVGPPADKTCELAQVVQVQLQGKSVPFSLVAISRTSTPKALKMVVQLPVNASFRGNVVLRADKADPGLAMPFARCVVAGCIVEFDLKDDTVKKLRTSAGAGSITFKSANEQDVEVPLSLKGVGPGLDALARE